ncbi:peptidylprolyl isomerase [Dongia sedimenti]|uniref:Parvulin-like PPIase n=1 Tax=Dongia sedimenti TaxID=3064282 RepID=A0ABU0YSE8_9PROT|nr:peptidylprolyl isomerase [Rhodospirillaceae bacterium R-7]
MTALALTGRSLNWRGKSGLPPARGPIHAFPGTLQSERLRSVLTQAQEAGIKGTIPEILCDPRLLQILSRQFKVPVPSLETCHRHYRDHLESFRKPERYLGRQIVLRCLKSDLQGRAEGWARAERLIAILFFDPKMFGDLVATYDSITDGSGSGRLGPVMRGELPCELDIALCGLRPGQIYPTPVATEQGIHVVMLDHILPGEVMHFASVHGRISATLRGELQVAAARRHLARLAERYTAAAAE